MVCVVLCCVVCFFKQKTAYEMRISDWSSDVCSSDLEDIPDVMAAYCEAIANCKIEGLELVSDDHSFCLLLVETQIPVDVAIGLAQDYNRDVLSRQKLAA